MLFDFLQVANTIGQSLELLSSQLANSGQLGRAPVDSNQMSLISRVINQQRRQEAPASSANVLNANQQQPLHFRPQAASDTRPHQRAQRPNQQLSNFNSPPSPNEVRRLDLTAPRLVDTGAGIRSQKGVPSNGNEDNHKPLDLSVKSGLIIGQPGDDNIVDCSYKPLISDDQRTLVRVNRPPPISLQTVLPKNGTQCKNGDIACTADNLVTYDATRRRARAPKQQVRSTSKVLITSSTSPSSAAPSTKSHTMNSSSSECNSQSATTTNPEPVSASATEPISSTDGTSPRQSTVLFAVNGRKNRCRKRSVETSSSGSGGGESTSRNGTRGHKCDQCGRSFSRSDMLTRHSRLHSGHKPYQCGRCSQVFSRSDHLSTHERTHTGEKPYQCEFCPYSACRRDMITRHMRTHSNSRRNIKPRKQRRQKKLACLDERSSPSDMGEPESSNIEAETSEPNDDAMMDQPGPE